MHYAAVRASLSEILPLRERYLAEMNAQVRYHACHERGWSDSYLLQLNGHSVGYGAVKGQEIKDRDTVFEFFVVEPQRRAANELFMALLAASQPQFIECQTNDAMLAPLFFQHAKEIAADAILFAAATTAELRCENASVRPRQAADDIFAHTLEPVGDYVLELGGKIVATGGYLLHYNRPFADLYLEVQPDFRGRGLGSFLVQEIVQLCSQAGHIPAARCGVSNAASRGALTRGGLRVCGYVLKGTLT